MTIQCPACRARYKIDSSKTSKSVVRVKCPKCNHVFSVEVEKESPASAAPAVKSGQLSAPPPATPPKILVVDDSKFFRELILDILQPLEMPLFTAADGEEALAVIRREHPALVLLDLNLPGKNGYELIREIRADASLRGIRLLTMSAVFRKEADVAKVEMAGADEFINKSFKPEQLRSRVIRLLKRARP